MIGSWSNQSLNLRHHSVDNTERASLLEISNPTEWAGVLKIRPILAVFNADGTYYSDYRDLEDTLVYRPSGIWKILADTCISTKSTLPIMRALFSLIRRTLRCYFVGC